MDEELEGRKRTVMFGISDPRTHLNAWRGQSDLMPINRPLHLEYGRRRISLDTPLGTYWLMIASTSTGRMPEAK